MVAHRQLEVRAGVSPSALFQRHCHFYGHANKVLLGQSTSHTSACTHAKSSLTGP